LALFCHHGTSIDRKRLLMKNLTTKQLKINELESSCETLLKAGHRMVMAYAWFPPKKNNAEILYLANCGQDNFELWRCQLKEGEIPPSLAQLSPLLGWYEREITDLLGVQFANHPEAYPLVLHEGAELSKLPLASSEQDELLTYHAKPWQLPEVPDKNLQRLPFGPIRADVTESAEFNYFYAGESIVYFYEKLFFKHRGMEKKFCGLSPDLGVVLAERVSGIGSASHAIAYCQAVESAADCQISKYAAYCRIIIAELERLYNHLEYLGHLCSETTLKVAGAEGKLFSEQLKQINSRVSGSRFLRSLLIPGGLRRALNVENLKTDLLALMPAIEKYMRRLDASKSHVDRLLNTGVVSTEVGLAEGATGPVERAANIDHDLRRDHPYSAYDDFKFDVPLWEDGSAYGREQVRMMEIAVSFKLIFDVLDHLPEPKLRVSCQPAACAEGLSWAESPRGGLFYAVHIDEKGRLARVKIKSPSYSNWRVFPFTVQGTGIMDFAINEASFGLSTGGCDR
jgi:formate hydrogenlyase subunit 5